MAEYLAIALALAVATPAWGQDDFDNFDDLDALDELDALDGSRGLEATGFLSETTHVYVTDRDDGTADEQQLLEVQLEVDAHTDVFDVFVHPRFLVDVLDTELLRYEPLEAYFDVGGRRWDLRVGQFVDSWGIADTFNPLDVLNRRDLGGNPIRPQPLGELGTRFRIHGTGGSVLGEPTLSAYAMPVWRATMFPTENSRYALPLDEEALVRPDFANGFFGAVRADATLSTSVGSADVQIVGARGPERMPNFGFGPQGLVPQYYGSWVAGGGFRAVPANSHLTLKAEAVYKRPYELDTPVDVLPEDYVQFAVGIDRAFSGLASPQDQLTLTVEYLGEAGGDEIENPLRPLGSDVAFRVAWDAGNFSRTSVEARGIVDVASADVIAEGVFKTQLRFVHDDLGLLASAQVFGARTADVPPREQRPNNSRVSAGLRFDF